MLAILCTTTHSVFSFLCLWAQIKTPKISPTVIQITYRSSFCLVFTRSQRHPRQLTHLYECRSGGIRLLRIFHKFVSAWRMVRNQQSEIKLLYKREYALVFVSYTSAMPWLLPPMFRNNVLARDILYYLLEFFLSIVLLFRHSFKSGFCCSFGASKIRFEGNFVRFQMAQFTCGSILCDRSNDTIQRQLILHSFMYNFWSQYGSERNLMINLIHFAIFYNYVIHRRCVLPYAANQLHQIIFKDGEQTNTSPDSNPSREWFGHANAPNASAVYIVEQWHCRDIVSSHATWFSAQYSNNLFHLLSFEAISLICACLPSFPLILRCK